ncbi:MAG: segregation/condensation protein A, partial [Gammaproteobacteria bacterium]|nr:segregation/condensation protein A [Gammaproteobacteria bacterium]
ILEAALLAAGEPLSDERLLGLFNETERPAREQLRDVFQALAEARFKSVTRPLPTVTLDELLRAFSDALARAAMYTHHHIQREPLSVRERMSQILSRIQADHFTEFQALFPHEEGRRGVVVTFLALLELIKESLIELVQHDLYGTIHIRSASTST